MTRPGHSQRTFQALFLFWLANSLGLNLLLARLPGEAPTTLTYTLAFFAGSAHNDSWKFMRTALDYLASAHSLPSTPPCSSSRD